MTCISMKASSQVERTVMCELRQKPMSSSVIGRAAPLARVNTASALAQKTSLKL